MENGGVGWGIRDAEGAAVAEMVCSEPAGTFNKVHPPTIIDNHRHVRKMHTIAKGFIVSALVKKG